MSTKCDSSPAEKTGVGRWWSISLTRVSNRWNNRNKFGCFLCPHVTCGCGTAFHSPRPRFSLLTPSRVLFFSPLEVCNFIPFVVACDIWYYKKLLTIIIQIVIVVGMNFIFFIFYFCWHKFDKWRNMTWRETIPQ